MSPRQPLGTEGWSGRKAPNDLLVPSMSTLASGTLASEGLTNWAINSTADWTMANLGDLIHMDLHEARDLIVNSRWEGRDGYMSAAARGTYLHEVLEAWCYGVAGPEIPLGYEHQLAPAVRQLHQWFVDNEPELVAAEVPVFNEEIGAAGRFDLVARFGKGTYANGRTYKLDLKSKDDDKNKHGYPFKPYGDSVALQLAGYRWARHWMPFPPRTKGEGGDKWKYGGRVYLLNDRERDALQPTEELWGVPSEELETAVIFLTPARCELYPIDTGPDVLDALKHVRAAWEWKNMTSKNVVGAPS